MRCMCADGKCHGRGSPELLRVRSAVHRMLDQLGVMGYDSPSESWMGWTSMTEMAGIIRSHRDSPSTMTIGVCAGTE